MDFPEKKLDPVELTSSIKKESIEPQNMFFSNFIFHILEQTLL